MYIFIDSLPTVHGALFQRSIDILWQIFSNSHYKIVIFLPSFSLNLGPFPFQWYFSSSSFSPYLFPQFYFCPFLLSLFSLFGNVFLSQMYPCSVPRSIICDDYRMLAEECDLNCNVAITLLINVGGNAPKVDIATRAGGQAMKSALGSTKCSTTPSPTITALTTSSFAQQSSWRK